MQNTEKREIADLPVIAGSIHRMLLAGDYPAVVETIREHIGSVNFKDLEQYFLIRYQYNYRTRFLHKADYDMCMKLSAVLNRRDS